MSKLEKIILIAVIFLLIFSICMLFVLDANASEIHGNFNFGYVLETESFCTDLSIRYDFWIISLGGGIETLMERSPTSAIFFCPYRNIYSFEAAIKPFDYLYLDFKHSCTHPVFSYTKQFYDKFEGGNRTDISIGIIW